MDEQVAADCFGGSWSGCAAGNDGVGMATIGAHGK